MAGTHAPLGVASPSRRSSEPARSTPPSGVRAFGNQDVQRLAGERRLPVSAVARLGNQAIQRYFDLGTATHAGLGVQAQEGTRFPGHEQDATHPDFLNADKTVNRREKATVPDLAVSDDGRMAIESAAVNGGREVEAFFADPSVVSEGNATLASMKSELLLKPAGGEAVDVPDLVTSHRHRLGKVIAGAANPPPKREDEAEAREPHSGTGLFAPEQCVAIAQAIIGQVGLVLKMANQDVDIYSENDMREHMLQFLAGYLEAASKDPAEVRAGKQAAYIEAAKVRAKTKIPFDIAMRTVSERFITLEVYAADREAAVSELLSLKADGVLSVVEEPLNSDWEYTSGYLGWDKYKREYRVTAQTADGDDFVRSSVKGKLKDKLYKLDVVTRQRQAGVDQLQTGANIDRAMDAVLNTVQSSNAQLLAEANKRLGVDEYAQPGVGEAFMIIHKKDKAADQNFPYHFAAVVAKSGEDSVTLENYARAKHEDHPESLSNRMYFQMYGPKREVDVAEGQVRKQRGEGTPDEQEAREYAAGSFHGRWKGLFSAPSTVTLKKG
jgi:hypothetical protein